MISLNISKIITVCQAHDIGRKTKKKRQTYVCRFTLVLALPIFPGRLQPSIFGAGELNCRVRDGNGWTLTAINTNYFNWFTPIKINYSIIQRSHYAVKRESLEKSGDPCGNRTHVCGVRGRRLSRLTNGPYGAPSRIRTGDPLIKSQLLYQLS